MDNQRKTIKLTSFETKGKMSVEQALYQRRSKRNVKNKTLNQENLSQILWAAYGITEPKDDSNKTALRLKTVPSAGTIYPLTLNLIISDVENIDPGIYKYIPANHAIELIKEGNFREDLSKLSSDEIIISKSPLSIIYTAKFENRKKRFRAKGYNRFIYIELGHSAQNVYLQAESRGMSTCVICDFEEIRIQKLLDLSKEEIPIYIMPLGNNS